MKTIKQLILAICLLTTAYAKAQTKDYVVFSGKIENATNHELILFDVYNNKKTIMVDQTGRFKDTVHVITAGHYRFYDNKDKLAIYLENGKDLTVAYDAKNFDGSIRFSGPGAAPNNYIRRKEEIRKQHEQKPLADGASNVFTLSEASFKAHYSDMKKAMLGELSATAGLSDQYKKLEARNINYEYLYFLSQYEAVQVNHMKKPDFKASKAMTEELEGFDATNQADFLFSDMYRNIIQSMYYEDAGKKSIAEGIPRDVTYLKLVSTIDNAFIRDYLLYRFAASYFNYTTDREGFYNAFMKGSSNEADKTKITKMRDAINSLVVNAPSPKFVNYENYAGGTSSLDDFKGKYLFIDVWATWCGPCIYEMPFLDKLEDGYKGKNITFITLSIDKKTDRQKWKDYVKEKNLDGVQLLADDAFNSAFIKAYNITGIPRFLIIDPKGNIVSTNAPRPSDPKLKELLDSLPL
ncbi:TlpA family protein disulfide reductase [Pedobacter deserti]|uniref:TlpA family protein disulfide reductase n=1 Tax=Pedobacter deserti TaxID=2817382 RepID=UPI00210DF640|nr:TlpA disulfide reductase family protein [Pedobacter sp. SYSU D00382]